MFGEHRVASRLRVGILCCASARRWVCEMILSLDTATDSPTLAVGTPEEPGEDVVVASRRELSREIERIARRLLDSGRTAPKDLGAVLVADGPGSFTGLRIGVAFAKGLCRVLGIPLYAAPSVMGAAWRAVAAGAWTAGADAATVLATYDALRGDVYRSVYRFEWGVGRRPSRIETLLAPELARRDAPPSHPPSAVGRHAHERHASAAALLSLIGVQGGAIRLADPASFEPSYGRLAEAEVRLAARHGTAPHG